jgi:hypothetical protein
MGLPRGPRSHPRGPSVLWTRDKLHVNQHSWVWIKPQPRKGLGMVSRWLRQQNRRNRAEDRTERPRGWEQSRSRARKQGPGWAALRCSLGLARDAWAPNFHHMAERPHSLCQAQIRLGKTHSNSRREVGMFLAQRGKQGLPSMQQGRASTDPDQPAFSTLCLFHNGRWALRRR